MVYFMEAARVPCPRHRKCWIYPHPSDGGEDDDSSEDIGAIKPMEPAATSEKPVSASTADSDYSDYEPPAKPAPETSVKDEDTSVADVDTTEADEETLVANEDTPVADEFEVTVDDPLETRV